jgi:uncharacterized damage-inducible protein DinB
MSPASERVHNQYQRLESRRKSLMEVIHSMPDELYVKNPSPAEWSVAQVAQHLFLSESLSLAYLRKKLMYPESVPRYHPKSWLGILLTKVIFLTGYKVKAPPMIDMWKKEHIVTPEELDIQWSTMRKELMEFIETHHPAFGTHLAFRHPFAGRMTMYQMLMFFNAHMAHHQKQVRRILKKIGY